MIYNGNTKKKLGSERRPVTSRIRYNSKYSQEVDTSNSIGTLQFKQAASILHKVKKTRTKSSKKSSSSSRLKASQDSGYQPSFRSSTRSSNLSFRAQRQLSMTNSVVNKRLSDLYAA